MNDDLIKRDDALKLLADGCYDPGIVRSISALPAVKDDSIEQLKSLTRGQEEQLEIQGNELIRRASHGHKQADRIEQLEKEKGYALERIMELDDRIEQLERENAKLGREVNMAKYGEPNFAWSIHNAAMADLQAKLAKAVDALRDAEVCLRQSARGDATINDMETWADDARTTLAELEKE